MAAVDQIFLATRLLCYTGKQCTAVGASFWFFLMWPSGS